MLLFLYNTGARAEEATRLTVGDVTWGNSPAVVSTGKAASSAGVRFGSAPRRSYKRRVPDAMSTTSSFATASINR